MAAHKNLLLNGRVYDCQPGETVLDALLRQKVDVPYACQKMSCMSCMMLSLSGAPPSLSQKNLKETLQVQNNFLACGCVPEEDMEIALPSEVLTRQVTAKVTDLKPLNASVLEIVLQCDAPIDFHGGQSVLLLNHEYIGKNFAIASPTSARLEGKIEVHVERIAGGIFSEWLHSKLKIGDQLIVSGVSGELFYTPGQPQQSILLAAWGGGLGAMLGLVQDIFELDHLGPVWLFHGVSQSGSLYFGNELREIEEYYPNFRYVPCVENGEPSENYYLGSVDQAISKALRQLGGWKVFLCGKREQVHKVQRYAYLAGAGMKDIFLEVNSI